MTPEEEIARLKAAPIEKVHEFITTLIWCYHTTSRMLELLTDEENDNNEAISGQITNLDVFHSRFLELSEDIMGDAWKSEE